MDFPSFREMAKASKFKDVSTTVFYRAKSKARRVLEGSIKDQYTILDDYCRQLMATNPGSTAILKTKMVNGKRVFERAYVCCQWCPQEEL